MIWRAQEIIEAMKPHLRNQSYHDALKLALKNLQNYLKSEDKLFSLTNILFAVFGIFLCIVPPFISKINHKWKN